MRLIAIGAMHALRDEGVRIPADVAVVGFDDIPSASLANPPLTTIRQPMLRMGEEAASALLDCVNSGHKKKKVQVVHMVLEPELVVRKSTQSPQKGKLRGDSR